MNMHLPKSAVLPGARTAHKRGVRLVALFEGAKGALVLAAGCGLLLLINRDVHQVAASLIKHIHLNPARHYPAVFLDLAGQISSTQLWIMAGAALAYAGLRLLEAVGLWLQRPWAEWLGVVSGSIYLPLEFYELYQGVTWQKLVTATVNLAIVGYLLYILGRAHQQTQ